MSPQPCRDHGVLGSIAGTHCDGSTKSLSENPGALAPPGPASPMILNKWPSAKQMRLAEKLYPAHSTAFSPLFLIRRPAPSPRSNHATRFTTSRSPTESLGRTAFQTHVTRAVEVSPAQPCQLPIGLLYAGGCCGVVKEAVDDHGPAAPSYSARTRQV